MNVFVLVYLCSYKRTGNFENFYAKCSLTLFSFCKCYFDGLGDGPMDDTDDDDDEEDDDDDDDEGKSGLK